MPRSPAFIDTLSPPDRDRLLARAVHRTLERGEPLHLAGEQARRAHFVSSGVLKLTARNAEGDETILQLALPGDLVGEAAAVDGLPQPFDAVAATTTEVVGVDADALVSVLASNPQASLEVARRLAQRHRAMCEAALERTTSDVPGRLAGRLLDIADLIGEQQRGAIEVELPLAQADLGRLAGMCRESACKTLRRFKAAGLVDYRGRRLRILQPDALRQIRCAGRASAPSP